MDLLLLAIPPLVVLGVMIGGIVFLRVRARRVNVHGSCNPAQREALDTLKSHERQLAEITKTLEQKGQGHGAS